MPARVHVEREPGKTLHIGLDLAEIEVARRVPDTISERNQLRLESSRSCGGIFHASLSPAEDTFQNLIAVLTIILRGLIQGFHETVCLLFYLFLARR